jgi:uncharacterized protein (TIGR03643 family)
MKQDYTATFISDIIGLAWADDVSFEKIRRDKGLGEADVIKIMRRNLKSGSFKLWRERVAGRSSKHEKRTRFFRQKAL